MATKTLERYPKDGPKDVIKVRGFFRLHIVDPDGTIRGDSGWMKNQVVNLGFNQYLVSGLGAIAGSKQVSFVALGSGTVPGAAATGITGEVAKRQSLTAATSSGSKTLRATATFSSSDSFLAGTSNLSNLGLVNNQFSSDAHTIFGGNTFASSSCATNQNVNVTYDIIFS